MDFDFGALDTAIEADWPVRVPVPQDGGGVQHQDLVVRFRFVEEELLQKHGGDLRGSQTALRMVVVGFGKDTKTKFTPELFDKMLKAPWVRNALGNAYTNFVLGVPAKNSETPLAS